MKIAFSIPTGYHARELLMPLKALLENDPTFTTIYVITPGAHYQQEIFPNYNNKFEFVPNPETQGAHDQLLRQLQPNLVVTNTSGLDTYDVPILRAARANNLPTLTFIASWDNIWKMNRTSEKHPLVIADHMVVWNEIMKAHLERLFPELKEGRVTVIGSPRFDFFHHQDRIPSRQQLFDKLSLSNPSHKLVHIATTELYPIEYVVKSIDAANKAKLINQEVDLYVSVHPGGDITKHQPYAEKYDVTVRYSFGRSPSAPHPNFQYNPTFDDIYLLTALFSHTDLLINQSSTVALESFAGDTPVITIMYGQPWHYLAWKKSIVTRDFKQHYRDILVDKPTRVVKTPKQLILAINDYLDHPTHDRTQRQKNLAKMTTITNGTASEQFLAHCKKVAQSSTGVR